MNKTAKSCYMNSQDKSLPSIYLPNNVTIILGRNVNTQIKDLKCSREQVSLCANYKDRIVTVQQIGRKSCGLNGAKIVKGEIYLAKNDDELELIYGKYLYKLEFMPLCIVDNDNDDVRPITKKRSIENLQSDDDDDDLSGKKRKIANKLVSITDKLMPSSSKIYSQITDANSKLNNGLWKITDEQSLMIFTSSGVQSRQKIACYDMDGTLITTISGNVFPKDHNDWRLLYPSIPNHLKKLHSDGYKVVIFTNQGALGLGKFKSSEFKKKVERVVDKIGVPIQVFIATGRDRFRKPMIGMWEALINENNDDIMVDLNESFYVGDAAGRPKDWKLGAKKDHSMVDRLFAINIGLRFQTPEEHFLEYKPVKFIPPSFDPKNLKTDADVFVPNNKINDAKEQEVIVLVGGPGSGKSYIVLNHLENYIHINRDTLGTWQKCISAMKKALNDGKSVVIDNTNPDVASRKRFLDVAKGYNVPVRCFIMNTSLENARHNNRFRELTDPTHTVISDIIINSYVKNYVEPSLTEGFSEIVRVNFVPKFKSDDHRQLYQMHLLEK